MPDLSPLVTGLLAFAAAWTLVIAIPGRVRGGLPRCRRCGADARMFAWREPRQCDCGAPLTDRSSIGWARERSKRLIVLACLLTVAAPLVAWWAVGVRARGIGWRDELPLTVYTQVLAPDGDEHFLGSAERRLLDGLTPEASHQLLDALLDSKRTDKAAMWLADRLGATHVPTGARGERFVQHLLSEIEFVAIERDGAIDVYPRSIEPFAGEIRDLLLRVDAIELNGRAVPFSLVFPAKGWEKIEHEQELAAGVTRLWHPLLDPKRTVQYRIEKATRGGGTSAPPTPFDPSAIRVRGEAAFAGPGLDTIIKDALIGSTRDPAAWGVQFGAAAFDRTALAEPGSPPLEQRSFGSSSVRDLAERWWGQPEYRPVMPAIAARAIVAMALTGALAGAAIPLAWITTRAIARGRRRWTPPACPGCGSFVRGEGDTLPSRCPECGRAIAGIDDCRCVGGYGPRTRRVLTVVVGVAALCGLAWLVPNAYVEIQRSHQINLEAGEAEAAWLVRATIDPPPSAAGPVPSNRLMDGSLDTVPQLNALFQTPELGRAATEALAAWWRTSGGALPANVRDPTGRLRREQVRRLVRQLALAGMIEPPLAAEILHWTFDPDVCPVPLSVPLFARAGEQVTPMLHAADTAIVTRAAGTLPWFTPRDCRLVPEASGEATGLTTIAFEWAVTVPPRSAPPVPAPGAPKQPQQPPRPPSINDLNAPAVLSGPIRPTALTEVRRVRAPILVVPADAPTAVTGPELDRLAPEVQFGLYIRPCGERSAIEVAPAFHHHSTFWFGRWELLDRDADDAEVLVSMPRDPSGPAPRGLARLPVPLPSELFVRYVPELPESAFTAPGKGAPTWGRPTTFRLRRRDDAKHGTDQCAVYATDACPVLRW